MFVHQTEQSMTSSQLEPHEAAHEESKEDDFVTVATDQFSQYTTTNFEDCPQTAYRNFCEGNCIHPSPFKYFPVETEVVSWEIKKGGWIFGDYSLFSIETCVDEGRYRVQRKDSSFYTLRKWLLNQYPHVMVPPLPT